ncbi:MAG: hypothetical protein H0U85_08435 [Gemmatimonadales bacterium]|nr:hypothetical protein [Gemmatimonadales bacterium]
MPTIPTETQVSAGGVAYRVRKGALEVAAHLLKHAWRSGVCRRAGRTSNGESPPFGGGRDAR